MSDRSKMAFDGQSSSVISEDYQYLFFDQNSERYYYSPAGGSLSRRQQLGQIRFNGNELSCVLADGKKAIALQVDSLSRTRHSTFSLMIDGRYIGTQDEHGYAKLVEDKRTASTFSHFYDEEIDSIDEFLRTPWFMYETGRFASAQIAPQSFSVQLGKRLYPLTTILKSYIVGKDVFLRRGYFVDKLCAFKPLVYYVAFGEGALSAMKVSLSSLAKLGNYDGDVCVITDEIDITSSIPDDFFGSVHILAKSAVSKDQFSRLRYEILDFDKIGQYSPILYLDVDVVVERSLADMFSKVILSGKVCAAVEQYPTFLESRYAYTKSVGSRFLSEDGFRPTDEFGFNSGVIAFKAHDVAEVPFHIISDTMIYMEENGLDLDWLDQAISNYVLQKCNCIDLKSISPFVGAGESHKIHLHPGELDTDHNTIVHFFATIDRVYFMREFIEDRMMRNKGGRQSPFSYQR